MVQKRPEHEAAEKERIYARATWWHPYGATHRRRGQHPLAVHLGGQYPEVLATHSALLRDAFAAYEGREVDTQGDSFFVVFPRATQAVAATVASQRALAAEPWPEDGTVRVRIGRHGGEEMNLVGDELLAVFDSAAAAIRCGCAIRDAVQGLGIAVKVGIHAGEVEYDDRPLGGITVFAGALITKVAQPGEVLTSNTVKDLVAGSGITFTERSG